MGRRQFEPLSAVLPDVLARAVEAGMSARALTPLWADAVGTLIAAKSSPLSLRDEALVIEVPDEAWLKELTVQHDALLARFQARAGRTLTVRKLVFKARQ